MVPVASGKVHVLEAPKAAMVMVPVFPASESKTIWLMAFVRLRDVLVRLPVSVKFPAEISIKKGAVESVPPRAKSSEVAVR